MSTLKMKAQRWFPIFLAMLMVVSLIAPTQVGAVEANTSTDQSAVIKEKVEQSVEKVKQYYEGIRPSGANSHSDYWLFSALWGAGVDLTEFPWAESKAPWEKDTFWTKGKDSPNTTSNEDAGVVIGSILLGQNPQKFGQRNIVQDLVSKQRENGSFFTIWGESWAMIALDLVDTDYDRGKHIAYILGQQNSKGTFGDIDSTGWLLTALAPYQNDRSDVKEAIDRTIQALYDGYQETGDIESQWGANSNTTAAALMGLAAVGENLFSEKWSIDGKNILEQFIETYQQENGSFWWQKNSAGAVGMATEQSLLALGTILEGESIFVQLKDHKNTNLDRTTMVKVRVEGINDTLYPEKEIPVTTFNADATAFDATQQALAEAEIPFEGSSSFISKIGDEGTAVFGGWDGWQFMVNDVYPSVSVGEYPAENGDEIVWFYGNVGDIYQGYDGVDQVEDLTLRPIISMSPQLIEDEEIEITVTANYNVYSSSFELEEENVKTNVKNADIYFNGDTYKTDENGVARIPGEKAKAGSYEIKVTKDIENSYPRLLRQSKKIIVAEKSDPAPGESEKTVTLSVEKRSINEGDILSPTTVTLQDGDTAFTLMERVVGSNSVKSTGSGASLYVQAIGGLGEFDKGELSGWMYSVNGTFPEYSAGSYILKAGDVLRWQYTTNLGKDIGGGDVPGGGGGATPNPIPETEEVTVAPNTPFTLDEKLQSNPSTPVILNFGAGTTELPQVTAPRGDSVLEIPQGTKVISDWDGKLQVPTSQSTSKSELEAINKVLGSTGKEIGKVELRIKVGGDQTIQFDQHVSLTFKGKSGLTPGFIGVDGKFELIGTDSTADVYYYVSGNDLIVKTKHFTDFLLFETTDKTIAFTDVKGHWAEEFILQAAQLGLIKGHEDGSFKPNNHLTRVQAASIIVRALDLKTEEASSFKDMKGYAAETQAEIATTYKYGLIIGQNGNFMPSKKVTRAQMALMLHRAYEQKTGVNYVASERAPYPDFGNYDEETVNAISMLYELGIATGSDGKYMPGNPTMRGQAAKMLVNFFEELK